MNIRAKEQPKTRPQTQARPVTQLRPLHNPQSAIRTREGSIAHFYPRCATLLPLPKGEGRGEGEGDNQSRRNALPAQPRSVSEESLLRTPHSALRTGFTLLELLVVIVIIGLLATIGLPAIRGMTKSNVLIAANRQLLDDIGYARQRAISDHATVYMVFIPPNITDQNRFPLDSTDANINKLVTNLYTGQYTTYALLSLRSVGDQPGVSNPRYLTPWRTLPTGVYIATNKFYDLTAALYAPQFATNVPFPFPVATNAAAAPYKLLPYIAFNHFGQLADGQPQYIPLARGSIFYTADGSGNLTADIVETPPGNAYYTEYASPSAQNNQILPGETNVVYNQIYIDPLTGRPRVQHQEVQ